MNFKFWSIALIFFSSETSNQVLGLKSFSSVLSDNLHFVKKLYNFKLNGVSYYENTQTLAKVEGGHPTSAVVSFRSQKTKASLDFDQGKQLFLNQFDMNLYNKMVDMLPRVVQAIEDTIFEDEPSWQEYQDFLNQCKNNGLQQVEEVAGVSQSLAKRMGNLGIQILKKIKSMATSTEKFSSKLVESLNAELSEQRSKYQEAVSKRSGLKRRKTTAEGNERYYRGKVSEHKSTYNTKAKLVKDLGISLGATGWMCFIGIPTCLGLAPAMAAEAVKRDKAWRQWKEAEKKVNQWVSEKNILGTSIRNYDRIISEGDNSILELTRNKSTFVAIRDHMKDQDKSLRVIVKTAEDTIDKIQDPYEANIVRGKIQLLKTEGKNLLDYFNGVSCTKTADKNFYFIVTTKCCNKWTNTCQSKIRHSP